MRTRGTTHPFFGHKPDCWLECLCCPRRHLAVLPANTRPSLFGSD